MSAAGKCAAETIALGCEPEVKTALAEQLDVVRKVEHDRLLARFESAVARFLDAANHPSAKATDFTEAVVAKKTFEGAERGWRLASLAIMVPCERRDEVDVSGTDEALALSLKTILAKQLYDQLMRSPRTFVAEQGTEAVQKYPICK